MVQITKQENELSHQELLEKSQQQQAQIDLLQAKLRDVVDGFSIIETWLSVAVNGDHADAPFPLDHKEASIHHGACASAYQHALEMCNSQSLTAFVESGFIEPTLEATVDRISMSVQRG